MIREHHSPDADHIALPLLMPWMRYPVCEKCGYQLGNGMLLLRALALAKGKSSQAYCYCAGDMNSTIPVPGMHIERGEATPKMVDVPVHCFGVYQEHLHLRCGRCGWQWLMAVKEKA
jgi:hypothetical protein